MSKKTIMIIIFTIIISIMAITIAIKSYNYISDDGSGSSQIQEVQELAENPPMSSSDIDAIDQEVRENNQKKNQ